MTKYRVISPITLDGDTSPDHVITSGLVDLTEEQAQVFLTMRAVVLADDTNTVKPVQNASETPTDAPNAVVNASVPGGDA